MDPADTAHARAAQRLVVEALRSGRADRTQSVLAKEEELRRTIQAPHLFEKLQPPLRKNRVAILATLALLNTQHHPAPIHIGNPDANNLADAKS